MPPTAYCRKCNRRHPLAAFDLQRGKPTPDCKHWRRLYQNARYNPTERRRRLVEKRLQEGRPYPRFFGPRHQRHERED